MKIKNIFYIVIISLILNSCSTVETVKYGSQPRLEEFPIGKVMPKEVKKYEKLRVATILPLTGKNAKIGKSMLNAINLSLFDNDHKDRIELFIFDNKSSDYNSKKIIKKIADKKIRLVIGPVFTSSIESISEIAAENNIVVLSFSNNSDLINYKGIFLSGFSPEQEIDRITSYLIDSGKSNFSVIAPNNQYGIRIAKTLREMAEIKDANFISSQFYINSKKSFTKIANTILNSYIVSDEIEEYQEELEAIEDKEEREIRELEIIAQHKIYADTILIAESGDKAFKIAKELHLNNVDGRDIQIIGTSHWDKVSILEGNSLSGAWFPGPNNKYYSRFKEKYNQIYGEDPVRISSIAYDVTAFVIDLSSEIKDQKLTGNDIVNYNGKKGYRGIDGLFRFLPNGIVERNLSVLGVGNSEFKIIDRAPRRFLNY